MTEHATTRHATGTFTVESSPGTGEPRAVARMVLAKTWSGDLEGAGTGLMLAAGAFETGYAGYVALEVVDGTLHGRAGTFALQQLGTVSGGEQSLTYLVTPGSGTGRLAGISGRLDLTIRDGEHHYDLAYALAEA